MSNYKDIIGAHIKSVTTDPPNPENGQMWYNSTDKAVKGFKSNSAGAWSSGGNMNTARNRGAGSGIQTSALAYGGLTGPGSPNKTGKTESYNGTAFSEVNDLNSARYDTQGAGTASTQALCCQGHTGPARQAITESWNGTCWTEVNDSNVARNAGGAAGSYTSAIVTGGDTPPGNYKNAESWNGTCWTAVSNMNADRSIHCMSGASNTASLAIGGLQPSPATIHGFTESWNGSAWTELNDLNSARQEQSGSGTYTSAVCASGTNPHTSALAVTETWNGTSWTEVADVSTARRRPSNNAGADSGSALMSGGGPATGSPVFNSSEEFILPATSTVTFTTS